MNDNDNGDSAKKRARAVTMMNDHGKVRLLIRTVILFDLFHLSMLGPQYSFKLTTIFCKFCKFWRHRIGNVQILSWKGLGMTFLSYFHFFFEKTPDPALPAASCALQAPGSPPYASNSWWRSSISKESNSLMKWPQHPPSHRMAPGQNCAVMLQRSKCESSTAYLIYAHQPWQCRMRAGWGLYCLHTTLNQNQSL